MIRHILDRIANRKVTETPLVFPPLDHKPLKEQFSTGLRPVKAFR